MKAPFAIVAALLLLGAAGAKDSKAAPLAAFATAVGALNGYQTSIHLYETKGTASEQAVFNYTFTKPTTIAMGVVSGPNAGSNVKYSSGNSVSAGKGMFWKSVALTDPLVSSLRGYTVMDLSFPGILKHAQTTAGTMSSANMPMGGAKVKAVTLTVADPASDEGMTREVLYLDKTTHLPLRIDGFIGSTLVRSYSFNQTKTH